MEQKRFLRIRFVQSQDKFGNLFDSDQIYINDCLIGFITKSDSFLKKFRIYIHVEKLDAREDNNLLSNTKWVKLKQKFKSREKAKLFFQNNIDKLDDKYIFHLQKH